MLSLPVKQRTHGRKAPPDCVVLHFSVGSGNEDSLGAYFQRNPQREASYNRGIGRTGGVAEYVDTTDTAWHAGGGDTWDGKRRLNDRSVGLCLCLLGPVPEQWAKTYPHRALTAKHSKPGVKSTTWERPPPAMITALRAQLGELKAKHPTIRYVLGHDDAVKGKIDPGPILDGVDLGLEALGLCRLTRRWDLPGAPWEGVDEPAAPIPAPAEPAPQAPPRAPSVGDLLEAGHVTVSAREFVGPVCVEPPAEACEPTPESAPITGEQVAAKSRAQRRAAKRVASEGGGSAGDEHGLPENQAARSGSVS